MKRPSVTVSLYGAGRYADGAARLVPQIRLRGLYIENVFAVGEKVRVTREERAGKLVLVIESISQPQADAA